MLQVYARSQPIDIGFRKKPFTPCWDGQGAVAPGNASGTKTHAEAWSTGGPKNASAPTIPAMTNNIPKKTDFILLPAE